MDARQPRWFGHNEAKRSSWRRLQWNAPTLPARSARTQCLPRAPALCHPGESGGGKRIHTERGLIALRVKSVVCCEHEMRAVLPRSVGGCEAAKSVLERTRKTWSFEHPSQLIADRSSLLWCWQIELSAKKLDTDAPFPFSRGGVSIPDRWDVGGSRHHQSNPTRRYGVNAFDVLATTSHFRRG
ncbi:hypothetical protein Enr13x_25460 [Stieleria neptunia]|uniref:Uncharacterized protein n=1 Tax=Stieleria neptunia TaxID=2527979 RepID=A0A518HPD0_9BACT|nr:hypothetical protein Enr13x_25460 [Stieleria neptunia]